MARRRDSFELQAAKGHPRKRLSRAERQRAEADSIAALLAASPSEAGDPLAPPMLLTDPRCAPALAVWREYVPKLSERNLFGALDRHTFAIFCVYSGEFVTAQQDILENGYSGVYKNVNGDPMPRANPSVDRRDTAQKVILEMSRRFGLTPIDLYALVASQASAHASGGGLFDNTKPSAQPKPSESEEPKQTGSMVGGLDRFDSAPPTTRLQ